MLFFRPGSVGSGGQFGVGEAFVVADIAAYPGGEVGRLVVFSRGEFHLDHGQAAVVGDAVVLGAELLRAVENVYLEIGREDFVIVVFWHGHAAQEEAGFADYFAGFMAEAFHQFAGGFLCDGALEFQLADDVGLEGVIQLEFA